MRSDKNCILQPWKSRQFPLASRYVRWESCGFGISRVPKFVEQRRNKHDILHSHHSKLQGFQMNSEVLDNMKNLEPFESITVSSGPKFEQEQISLRNFDSADHFLVNKSENQKAPPESQAFIPHRPCSNPEASAVTNSIKVFIETETYSTIQIDFPKQIETSEVQYIPANGRTEQNYRNWEHKKQQAN